jgi:hypothetical protein
VLNVAVVRWGIDHKSETAMTAVDIGKIMDTIFMFGRSVVCMTLT